MVDNSRKNYRQDWARSCTCRDNITSFPEEYGLAMAYVPVQTDLTIYDDMQALEVGTLFPVLNKPFLGAGCLR
ncbi:MAG: spore coat associated protein CotJA [Clostridia bacterium]|nr:spore coat associated protein CotJA [Clostridia bacterium]MBQ7046787.1 spore coat associated protein CotJA [Oscillospiraceae bacterium]